MYTPATTSDSDSDVMSTCSGKETVVNQDGKAASKIVKQPPGPVGASLGLIRSGAMLGAVKDNVNYGSSSDELAVPLERTYNSPVDKVIKISLFVRQKMKKYEDRNIPT